MKFSINSGHFMSVIPFFAIAPSGLSHDDLTFTKQMKKHIFFIIIRISSIANYKDKDKKRAPKCIFGALPL